MTPIDPVAPEVERLLKLRSALLGFQTSKGYLEQGLHELQDRTRLSYSSEKLLGMLHESDDALIGAMEWVDSLLRAKVGE